MSNNCLSPGGVLHFKCRHNKKRQKEAAFTFRMSSQLCQVITVCLLKNSKKSKPTSYTISSIHYYSINDFYILFAETGLRSLPWARDYLYLFSDWYFTLSAQEFFKLWYYLESITLFNQDEWTERSIYKLTRQQCQEIYFLEPAIDFTDKAMLNLTESCFMNFSAAVAQSVNSGQTMSRNWKIPLEDRVQNKHRTEPVHH